MEYDCSSWGAMLGSVAGTLTAYAVGFYSGKRKSE